jgi:hypothetical protein
MTPMGNGKRPPRLPVGVQRELRGVDWTWKRGSRHWMIYIGGRLATIWPHGRAPSVDNALNARADIRRAKRLLSVTQRGTVRNGNSRSGSQA